MTPTAQPVCPPCQDLTRLVQHDERIRSLEADEAELRDSIKNVLEKIDSLKTWIMGTLATAAIVLLVQLLKLR